MTQNEMLIGTVGVFLGILLAVIGMSYKTSPDTAFKVGDCVRILGYTEIERVTVVNPKIIETGYTATDGVVYYHTHEPEEIVKSTGCK